MDKLVYPSLKARLKTEYKIYIAAVIFILIADSIGQIQIPLGPGQFILFPIFYALIKGVLSGPQATKIMKSKEVKAASKLVIAALGVAVSKAIPLKLPVVAYVSIIGLLAACPISPCREFVIDAAGKINFTAPLTMVGAYAGISISDQIKSFLKQGWKMILVGVFVMTGTFVGSALIAHVVLKITGAI